MKYIRTKDNAIYKIENNKLIVGNIKVNCKDLQALEQEGYKIADTIEELCDEFVGEFVDGEKVILEKWNGNKFVIRWATNMVSMIKDLNKTYANVKGAIWTNKGLIYVAKMNDDGELELI